MLTLDPASGAVVSDWGSNLFYMPHGIAVDAEDNIWVTDVALHQALKVGKSDTSVTVYYADVSGWNGQIGYTHQWADWVHTPMTQQLQCCQLVQEKTERK